MRVNDSFRPRYRDLLREADGECFRLANAAYIQDVRGLLAVLSLFAASQLPLPLPTTTTTAPPSTTTTTAPLLSPLGGSTTTTAPPSQPSGPTTTAPPPSGTSPPPTSPSSGTTPPPPQPPAGGADGEVPDLDDKGGFPEHLRKLMESVDRTSSSSTRPLIDALRPLVEVHGLIEADALKMGFGPFPVRGLATYTHDWWFPRYGPGWRLHEGTDIFAAIGTEVVSPISGTVKLAHNKLGGTSAWVVADDGTYVYLTHLSGYRDGLMTGMRVESGEVVGYVGNSGNASTTPPHLHIEFHPGGGPAVDPKPILDQMLKDGLARASAAVAAQDAARPPAVQMLGLTRGAARTLPAHTTLLWMSAMTPAGAVEFAVREGQRALRGAGAASG